MTQTETTAWTVTTTPTGKPDVVNLRAISPTRDRVINRKNVNVADVATFDGDAVWAIILVNTTKFGGK